MSEYESPDDPADENVELEQELRLLGKDPSVFDDLPPDELNVRLKRSIDYAEQAREAELLGKEPPPEFLDPTSPHWIPDVEDIVTRSTRQLLGEDFVLWPEEVLTDEEVVRELHKVIDKLAEHRVEFGIREEVPERLAYRYLLEEMAEGVGIMPMMMNVIDGCSGACEECFQLPYCVSGRQMAEDHDFAVPEPPLPPRTVSRDAGPGEPGRPYWRDVPIPEMPDISELLGGNDREGNGERYGEDEIPF